jgi:hypothetical protein
MKKLIFVLVCLAFAILLPTACKEDAVKLTRDDREMIDTLSQKEIVRITPELERYCRDSSPILRKHYVDSLLIVREQEILQKTVPVQ